MTGIVFSRGDDDAALAQAGDWIARLQAGDLGEADAEAFDAWLNAAPANARAYDRALETWMLIGGAAAQVLGELDARSRRPQRRGFDRRWILVGGGMAAAAAMALTVLPISTFKASAETYATAKGEHRSIKLADGSQVDLNADTRLDVTLTRGERRVVMGEGEAVFDVAPDTARPFTIAAADHVVRVVGTQFDVRNRGAELSVTVTRGMVEVRPQAAGGRAFRLHPGQRLDLGMAGEAKISVVAAEEALSWRNGRVVYRAEPLSHVVDDLNRQFARPITIADAELANTQVSGVLVIDNQADVIQRLTLMLPISAVPSEQGVLLYRK